MCWNPHCRLEWKISAQLSHCAYRHHLTRRHADCITHRTHVRLYRRTCTCTRTHTPSQHILSHSASQSQVKRAPGPEAVNLPHVDMDLWMAYTQRSCWADQSQITFANNFHYLFSPNEEPGARGFNTILWGQLSDTGANVCTLCLSLHVSLSKIYGTYRIVI